MCPEALTRPIVVAVDGSPHSDAAVEWSARESVLRNARVQLIHVIAPMPEPWAAPADESSAVDRWHRDRANAILTGADAKFRSALGKSGVADVETAVLEAPVVPALIDASARAQLIVVGSRGLGTVSRLLLGSASTGLVHHARCPVAVIPLDETTARQPNTRCYLAWTGRPLPMRRPRAPSARRRDGRRSTGGARVERRRHSTRGRHGLVVRPREGGERAADRIPRSLAGEVFRRARGPARRV